MTGWAGSGLRRVAQTRLTSTPSARTDTVLKCGYGERRTVIVSFAKRMLAKRQQQAQVATRIAIEAGALRVYEFHGEAFDGHGRLRGRISPRELEGFGGTVTGDLRESPRDDGRDQSGKSRANPTNAPATQHFARNERECHLSTRQRRLASRRGEQRWRGGSAPRPRCDARRGACARDTRTPRDCCQQAP